MLNKRDDVWFVFMNTNKFIDHPRALFLESSSKLENKSAFVHGCDAMIHARRGGETFGLACAEFNMANKPVITWGGSHDNAHIHMLKDSALVYDTREGLEYIIESFPLSPKLFPKYPYNNWKQYDDYSEEIVMKEFERVFLS